jgi:hypothetical protein
MEIDEHGQQRGIRRTDWPVQAQWDRAVRSAGLQILHVADLRGQRLCGMASVAITGACVRHAQLVSGWEAALLDQVEKGTDFRMQHRDS